MSYSVRITHKENIVKEEEFANYFQAFNFFSELEEHECALEIVQELKNEAESKRDFMIARLYLPMQDEPFLALTKYCKMPAVL
jgi:hypothetical protein